MATCGSYLKEHGLSSAITPFDFPINNDLGTSVKGVFRLSGSESRIRELYEIFDCPPYGRGFNLTGYDCYEVAHLLRRYLLQLPESVIPHRSYKKFCKPFCNHGATSRWIWCLPAGQFDNERAIRVYQKLIGQLDRWSRALVLYLLDLLAVFASKASENRMTAPNLSKILQPCFISHPRYRMNTRKWEVNRQVMTFLIENQEHFRIEHFPPKPEMDLNCFLAILKCIKCHPLTVHTRRNCLHAVCALNRSIPFNQHTSTLHPNSAHNDVIAYPRCIPQVDRAFPSAGDPGTLLPAGTTAITTNTNFAAMPQKRQRNRLRKKRLDEQRVLYRSQSLATQKPFVNMPGQFQSGRRKSDIPYQNGQKGASFGWETIDFAASRRVLTSSDTTAVSRTWFRLFWDPPAQC